MIVSAHTHAEYRCTCITTNGVTRLVTSASSFGRILSDLTLTINDKSGELRRRQCRKTSSWRRAQRIRSGCDSGGRSVGEGKSQRVAAVVQQYVTASARSPTR